MREITIQVSDEGKMNIELKTNGNVLEVVGILQVAIHQIMSSHTERTVNTEWLVVEHG